MFAKYKCKIVNNVSTFDQIGLTVPKNKTLIIKTIYGFCHQYDTILNIRGYPRKLAVGIGQGELKLTDNAQKYYEDIVRCFGEIKQCNGEGERIRQVSNLELNYSEECKLPKEKVADIKAFAKTVRGGDKRKYFNLEEFEFEQNLVTVNELEDLINFPLFKGCLHLTEGMSLFFSARSYAKGSFIISYTEFDNGDE